MGFDRYPDAYIVHQNCNDVGSWRSITKRNQATKRIQEIPRFLKSQCLGYVMIALLSPAVGNSPAQVVPMQSLPSSICRVSGFFAQLHPSADCLPGEYGFSLAFERVAMEEKQQFVSVNNLRMRRMTLRISFGSYQQLGVTDLL